MRRGASGAFRAAVMAAAGLAAASCRPTAPSAPDLFGISVPYEVTTLDPHARDWAAAFALASHVYEPLATTDASLVAQPALARRWESPDSRTWVFHLRPDVRFHSGRPLTAGDVVYSIQRLKASRDLEMSAYVRDVETVRSLGSQTVEIRTRAASALLLANLRFVLVVPSGATAESLAAAPDGTGPYRVASWTPRAELRLVRNDAYWGGAPFLRRVAFWLARSPSDALDDFQRHRSRLAQCDSKLLEAALAGRTDVQVLRRTSLFTKFLGFDLDPGKGALAGPRRSPFLDRRVRRALHMAVDRASLAARLSTYAVPAYQMVPPSVFGHDPDLPPVRYDPEGARALLREAGYPDGVEATLQTRRIFEEPARLLAAMLAPVGFRLQVRALPDEEYFPLVRTNRAGFFLSRRACPTGDLGSLLENSAHTYDPERHFGTTNDGRYSSPALDRAIEASSRILDMTARREALHALMGALMDELVWVPLYVDEDVYALVQGFSWQPRADSYVLAQEVGPAPAR